MHWQKVFCILELNPEIKLEFGQKMFPTGLTFMFATAKIGAVLVTINTNYKLAELEYLLQRCRC